jgi:hypothetical protein
MLTTVGGTKRQDKEMPSSPHRSSSRLGLGRRPHLRIESFTIETLHRSLITVMRHWRQGRT